MESLNQVHPTEKESVPKYDAIVVLGRGIGQNSFGKWKPVSYFVEESLHSGVFDNKVNPNSETSLIGGGNANTLALYHFYRQLSKKGFPPKLVVFAAGRPDYLANEDSDLSEGRVMRNKFLNKLGWKKGVQQPDTVILNENKNTRDDMVESLRMIKERGFQNVVMITVDVQIERAKEFLRLAREQAGIPEKDVHIDFKASEGILMEVSDKYKNKLGKTSKHVGYRETTGYLKTEAMEKRGVQRLRYGTYFTTGPYAPSNDKKS